MFLPDMALLLQTVIGICLVTTAGYETFSNHDRELQLPKRKKPLKVEDSSNSTPRKARKWNAMVLRTNASKRRGKPIDCGAPLKACELTRHPIRE